MDLEDQRWWHPLLGLSRASWIPKIEPKDGEELALAKHRNGWHPSPQTAEIIGKTFRAAWIRWWLQQGKQRPIRLLQSWARIESAPDSASSLSSQPAPENAPPFVRLLELAAEQKHPIWVESETGSGMALSDWPVFSSKPRMLASINGAGFRGQILEVGLDSDRSGLSDTDRERYLMGLRILQDEMARWSLVHRVPLAGRGAPLEEARSHPRGKRPATDALAAVADLRSILEEQRQETMRQIELYLKTLAGTRLDSFSSNQLLAKTLHRLLDSHGFRLRCPECGEPSIMRCLASGNSQTGSFVFDHRLSQGRTFHGGKSSIPILSLVPKPARRMSRNQE